MTIQHLKPDTTSRFPIPQFDARITSTGISPSPNILLDFMYGVAAYKRWGAGQEIKDVMLGRFTNHYGCIPQPPASASPASSDGNPQSLTPMMMTMN